MGGLLAEDEGREKFTENVVKGTRVECKEALQGNDSTWVSA